METTYLESEKEEDNRIEVAYLEPEPKQKELNKTAVCFVLSTMDRFSLLEPGQEKEYKKKEFETTETFYIKPKEDKFKIVTVKPGLPLFYITLLNSRFNYADEPKLKLLPEGSRCSFDNKDVMTFGLSENYLYFWSSWMDFENTWRHCLLTMETTEEIKLLFVEEGSFFSLHRNLRKLIGSGIDGVIYYPAKEEKGIKLVHILEPLKHVKYISELGLPYHNKGELVFRYPESCQRVDDLSLDKYTKEIIDTSDFCIRENEIIALTK